MTVSAKLVAHRTRGAAFRPVLGGPSPAYRWQDATLVWPCAGTALCTPEGVVLVDPPPLAPAELAALRAAGPPVAIALTTGAHDRAAALREALQIPIWCPEWPPTWQDMPPRDHLVRPGDELPGGLRAVAVPVAEGYGKGEVALRWPEHGGVLLTGDLVPRRGRRPVYFEGLMWPWPVYADALEGVLSGAGAFSYLFGGHDRPSAFAVAGARRALERQRLTPHVRPWRYDPPSRVGGPAQS